MHRGLDLVIALCGILKAGGAYLPIDPDAPPARVRLMVAEGAAPVSVGEQALAHLLPGDLTRVVLLDRDSALIDRHPTTPADSGVRPGDLVSLYYTSGSTGIPKGVASTHGGWVNRMRWMQAEYRLEPGEAVLHKTTLSFDDSAVEVFWPLSTGGVVAILPPGEHRDPVALLEATSRFGAVVVQFVPSMLALFLAAHRRAGLPPLPHLRHVISSGEALTAPWRSPSTNRSACTAAGCTTSGAPPRCRSTPPCTPTTRTTRTRARSSPSGRPSPATPCTCWTRRETSYPTGRRASCSSAGSAWHAATTAGPR